MRRLVWCLPVFLVAIAAPGAQAGTVAFSSDRCDNQADYEQRPGFTVPRDDSNPSCRPAIWLVEDDGSRLRRLTNGGDHQAGADFEPAWSPDGQRIAYAAPGSVMVVAADGGQPRRVASGSSPAWTPDGRWVVVSALDETDPAGTGDMNLYAVSLDGLRTTQLTSSPEDEIAPELSPDGRRLLFSRRLSGYQRFANREPDEPPREFVPGALVGWFSMSLPDRREERMVLSDQDPGWGARFSPDGQRIALSLFGALHTVNADGTGLRRHSAEGSVSPAWAGLDSLVYVRFQPGSSGGPALAKLRLGEAAEPVAITTPASRFGDSAPDWHALGGLPVDLPPVDELPPVVELLDGASGRRAGSLGRASGTAAAAASRSVSRRLLSYFAADRSGVRSLRVAFGLRRGPRCRFAGRRSFSRPRSCARPLYRPVSGPAAWRSLTSRLRAGRYVVLVRAGDSRGNRPKRPRRIHLRIRP